MSKHTLKRVLIFLIFSLVPFSLFAENTRLNNTSAGCMACHQGGTSNIMDHSKPHSTQKKTRNCVIPVKRQ